MDDDLWVYVNGSPVFEDTSGTADDFPPIEIPAEVGDRLRIVAQDTFGICRGLSPRLSLYRVDAGTFQLLRGYEGACYGDEEGTVFYDETFTVGVGDILTWSETVGGGNPSFGCECSSSLGLAHSGSWPVNASTGEFFHTFTDLQIPGRGMNLEFARTYSSLRADQDGLLGHGWSSSYEVRLESESSGELITVHQENGSTVTFVRAPSGDFLAPPHVLASLTQSPDGTYEFDRDVDRTTLTFDPDGNLTSVRDRNGYVTTFSYSANRLAAVTDEAGRSLTFTYWTSGSAAGKLRRITDPAGRVVTFAYDTAGDLVEATDVGGESWQFAYDADHRMLSMTGPRGGVITNVYDGAGRIESQTDPMGRETTYAYWTDGRSEWTTVTNARGVVTEDRYVDFLLRERIEAIHTGVVAITNYTYDPDTLGVTTLTDPNGNRWTSTFDARGNKLTSSDPSGNTTTFTYNSANDVLTVTDPVGTTTTNTYDARGNLTGTSTPAGGGETATTTFSYDPAFPGDLVQTTDAEGHDWRYSYNRNGDRVESIDPLGNSSSTVYDEVGRIRSSTTPSGAAPGDGTHTTSFDTNAYGDPTRVVDPTGEVTSYEYNADGNLTRTTDPRGKVAEITYNLGGEPTATVVRGPDGSIERSTETEYDEVGNVVRQIDGLGRATIHEYDPLNRREVTYDPLLRQTRYFYDAGGRLIALTDGGGHATSYRYDPANRLVEITYDDGVTPSVGFSYDAAGRRTSMLDGPGGTNYSYDSLGRLVQTTQSAHGVTDTVGYGYDLAGRLTEIEYPGGQTVAREYDAAGRLSAVSDWLGHTTRFEYDAAGNLVTQLYPNGVTGAFTYDPRDRVVGISHSSPGGTLLDLDYSRGASGLLEAENGGTFRYDGLDQLVRETSDLGTGTFGYDAAGAVTTIARSGAQSTMELTYDAGGQLTSTDVGDSHTSFSYDARGNRLDSLPAGGAQTTYVYDQANRLTSFARGSTAATYSYNGDGLRLSKTVSEGARRSHVWNVAEGLPTMLVDGGTRYVTGPGGLPLERISATGEVRFFHQDQLGSTRLLTDATGAARATFRYGPYGDLRTKSKAPDAEPLGYAGQYRDAESGLIYLRARYYDPATAQFTSKDPMVEATGDPYAYAANDPVNNTDPTGMAPWDFVTREVSLFKHYRWSDIDDAYRDTAHYQGRQTKWGRRAWDWGTKVALVSGTIATGGKGASLLLDTRAGLSIFASVAIIGGVCTTTNADLLNKLNKLGEAVARVEQVRQRGGFPWR